MARAFCYHTALDQEGRPIAGAVVYVYDPGTTNLIADVLYEHDDDHVDAADTLSNPLSTNNAGEIEFWLASPRKVDLRITATGKQDQTIPGFVTRVANDGATGTPGADGLISEVQNEGVAVTDAGVMDFTGDGVNVTSDGTKISVAVAGADLSAYATDAELAAHEADTTNVHGITDTAQIAVKNAAQTFTAAQTISGGTTATDRLNLGADTTLYRFAADKLASDDVFIAQKGGAEVQLGGFSTGNPAIVLGGDKPILARAGSPEGVVSAAVGGLYLRTDGGVGSTFYVKQSGSGNVGWGAK